MRPFLFVCMTLLLVIGPPLAAQKVRCESVEGEYRECYVASGGKVILDFELSDLRCIQGVSWGTASAGMVWVQRGCRGIFTVGVETQPTVPADLVVCESTNGGRAYCSTRKNSHVTLSRRLSNLPCDEGGSWGYDPERGEIWVDQGCRGEFRVGAATPDEQAVGHLDAIVVCQSSDGRKAKCSADTSAGVQLFRPLNQSRCRFGKEWGYDRKQIWVKDGCSAEFAVRGKPRPTIQSIVCESPDGSPAKCEADTTYGIAIARELGEEPCIAGRTWGFDGNGVWVSGKCVALFALGGYRLPADRVPETAARVICESKPGEVSRCEVDTRRGVGLIEELGGVTCVLNRSWGYDSDGIWVRDGCSAEFAVAR